MKIPWIKRGVVVLVMVVLVMFPIPVLLVSEPDHPPALVIPLVHGKTFSLEYVHSVQKTPVQEHFSLAPGNKLVLKSTTYQSLGVGLPFLPEEGNLVNDNGTFVLSGLNRQFNKIRIGFMPLAHQGLLYHGQHYQFKYYFAPGTLLEIEAKVFPLFITIWQVSHVRGG